MVWFEGFKILVKIISDKDIRRLVQEYLSGQGEKSSEFTEWAKKFFGFERCIVG